MIMPKVSQCQITECSYNTGQKCHALAITIGDLARPLCDTFCDAGIRGGEK